MDDQLRQEFGVTLSDAEAGEDVEFIAASLGREVAAEFGPRDERPLSVLIRDAEGVLAGGLNGASHWRWLYIRHLWVAPARRGVGLGARLLREAEAAAIARDCVGLYLDTFNPRAERFYLANGFETFGRIGNFPPGRVRRFLRKTLRER